MEYRPLDITVISAKDLKDVNLFSKMDVYVVVSINGDPRTKQKTPVDKDCGTKPKWHSNMKFTIDEASVQQNRLTLVFHLKSDRNLGDRDIGEVHVPIKELLDQKDATGKVDLVRTFNVRLPNGKDKGTLDFSYKFGQKFTVTTNPQPPPPPPSAKKVDEPVMAYPPAGYAGGSSSAYPPPGGHWQQQQPPAYPPPGHYPSYPPPGAYPPPPPASYGYGGYPPAAGYGYPTQGMGGYGYPPVQQPQKPKKNKMGGMGGMGLGLGAGLLGGLLVGDMISDVSDVGAYDAGYMDGMGDGMDF